MNLMNMVRLCGVVAIGWTLLALGIGMLGTGPRRAQETSYFLPEPADHEAVAISQPGRRGIEEYRLVDRSTGRAQPLPLPGNASWGFVSVSPWRDQEGNLEAVGRWTRLNAGGEQAFCGLGLFRLSDRTVVRSIDLEVLPTGRPCWVPGRPGDLLFPAGDGQLYRCHLARDPDTGPEPSDRAGRPSAPGPVAWRCALPGSGSVFISDPVWPDGKQLQKYLFASLSLQVRVAGKLRYDTPRIWWLEMSERGDEVLSAGPLAAPAADGIPLIERMPNVTVGPSGRLTLAYLTRDQRETSWRLCLATLSLEKATRKPVIVGAPAPNEELTNGLFPIPPTFSSDGQAVFASTAEGRIKKYSVTTLARRTGPLAID